MRLTFRPTDLGSPIDNERKDYGVFSREWRIGRIYENRSDPEELRWFWAFHAPSKPGACASQIKCRRLKRPRRSSKQAMEGGGERRKRWNDPGLNSAAQSRSSRSFHDEHCTMNQ
jgi:hypothetical protein